VHIIEELLRLRAKQLKKRDEDLNETRNLLKRMRKKEKKYFDELHSIKNKEINFDDLVLLRDVQHENDRSIIRKMKHK
jgi:cytidylate kinase